MSAIFKREFKAYFSTPIGYIFLAVMFFWLGLWFWMIFSNGAPEMATVVTSVSIIIIFALPVLTMKLMSEDKRQKVDQALLTAPVRLTSIVMGKFLAAFAVYTLGFAPTVIYQIIIAAMVPVNLMSYIYSLLGMLLLGATLIAIGMFISSLTESSVISAILSIVINILVLYMSSFASIITPPTGDNFFTTILSKIVEFLVLVLEKAAFITVAESFAENIFSFVDIVYFLSIIAVFLFLCVRSLEKRRWS